MPPVPCALAQHFLMNLKVEVLALIQGYNPNMRWH